MCVPSSNEVVPNTSYDVVQSSNNNEHRLEAKYIIMIHRFTFYNSVQLCYVMKGQFERRAQEGIIKSVGLLLAFARNVT